ncbi:hypothetical protein ACVH9Z_35305 [Rhodococcus opacus]|uniref:hypothetical protein n=1 Tax=Rhodococcus opacus TaxID=37919 RepID=UPI00146B7580|nr:hypothetical protein [Rhodococcus opacus]MDJ0415408.1 hypothetical protein [Rhodococcus opacus]MDV7091154.1 hypothetical protein [Rhodococcus opacus]UNN04659.1 hypothetical protein MOO23_37185 [Rhodococcus opacus]WKN52458.1 hypothetical protein HJ581_0000520 [Rhodococcus opacus]
MLELVLSTALGAAAFGLRVQEHRCSRTLALYHALPVGSAARRSISENTIREAYWVQFYVFLIGVGMHTLLLVAFIWMQ